MGTWEYLLRFAYSLEHRKISGLEFDGGRYELKWFGSHSDFPYLLSHFDGYLLHLVRTAPFEEWFMAELRTTMDCWEYDAADERFGPSLALKRPPQDTGFLPDR